MEFLKEYFGEALALFLGAIINWLFNKRKENAGVTTTEIDNGTKVVELYKSALDDLSLRYEQKYQEIENRRQNIEKLFDSKEKLLQQELELLRKQVILYKKMYDDKVKEFNKYKKEHPAK